MKYQIQTATNHDELAQKVNAQFQIAGENWKPLGGVQIQAIPMQVQTLQGVQTGVTVIFAQSLVDYEDNASRNLGEWMQGVSRMGGGGAGVLPPRA